MDETDPEDWRKKIPESQRLEDSARVSDSQWSDLISQLGAAEAKMSEMPVEEIRDRLEEAEGWTPEPAAPIGWRTARPTLVLSMLAAFGAFAALVLGAIFFRPLPGWFLLVAIAVGVGGAVGLFFHLPKTSSDDEGNGAAV